MSEEKRQIVVVEGGRHTVLWVIALLLAVIATVEILQWDDSGVAYGQNVARAGAGGVFAFGGQMSKSTYGVYMVDVDSMVIWAYEIMPGSPKTMRLVGARSWAYDRYLEQYNVEKPLPTEVKELLAGQRDRQGQEHGAVTPDAGVPEKQ